MTRPDHLVIAGQPFEVRWDDRAVGRLHDARLPDDDLGTVQVSEQLIVIRAGQAPHSQRDAVLHEVIHALMAMTGHDEIAEQDEIERLVGALAVGLLAVLRQNPDATAWLAEPL